MQQHAKTIDIRTRSCLRFPILLWRGITGRAEGYGIFSLPRLKVSCNTKVNESNAPARPEYNIGRFEIAKNNGWLTRVQVLKHNAEHYADLKDFAGGKPGFRHRLQVFLKCYPFDEIHHQVPALAVREVVVNARKIGMLQAR